jgi:hypothetical protein
VLSDDETARREKQEELFMSACIKADQVAQELMLEDEMNASTRSSAAKKKAKKKKKQNNGASSEPMTELPEEGGWLEEVCLEQMRAEAPTAETLAAEAPAAETPVQVELNEGHSGSARFSA